MAVQAIAGGIEIVRTVKDLRARITGWRARGEAVGLVPTMGALHEGHLSLVRLSRAAADRTCVTVFVNPRQFGPDEDFARYPRDETDDAAKAAALGAELVFAPSLDEMYPEGSVTQVSVKGLGEVLDGAFRPGFFDGVATVVTKLLIQALPDKAFFGEKDYQQLVVVRRLVRDLDLPVSIEAGPTIREPDGLALSSRNAYLTSDERPIAPSLYRTIRAVAERVAQGAEPDDEAGRGAALLEAAGFERVDYVAVRDAETLGPVTDRSRPARVLAAAWLGQTRLIDNVAV